MSSAPPVRTWRVAAGLALATIGTVAVGLGVHGSDPVAEGRPVAGGAPSVDATLTAEEAAPLFFYRSIDEHSWTWAQAETERCMELAGSDGFEYEPQPFDPALVVGREEAAEAEERARFGFEISMDYVDGAPPPTDPNTAYWNSLRVEERDSFDRALDGCRTTAAEAYDRWILSLHERAPSNVTSLVGSALTGEATIVQEAGSAWADCIEDHSGERHTDPQAMVERLRNEWTAIEASGDAARIGAFRDRERGLAVADAQCSEEYLDPAFERLYDDVAEELRDADMASFTPPVGVATPDGTSTNR